MALEPLSTTHVEFLFAYEKIPNKGGRIMLTARDAVIKDEWGSPNQCLDSLKSLAHSPSSLKPLASISSLMPSLRKITMNFLALFWRRGWGLLVKFCVFGQSSCGGAKRVFEVANQWRVCQTSMQMTAERLFSQMVFRQKVEPRKPAVEPNKWTCKESTECCPFYAINNFFQLFLDHKYNALWRIPPKNSLLNNDWAGEVM